mgnify:CR=1 FL=1
MDYEKKLFEDAKANAPDNFVEKAMMHIKLKELEDDRKATAKIEYSFFKIGQICVVASLLLVILNVFPAAEKVFGQGKDEYTQQHESIFQIASDKFNELIEDAKELIDLNIFNKD